MAKKLDVRKSDSEQADDRYNPQSDVDSARQLNNRENDSVPNYDDQSDSSDDLSGSQDDATTGPSKKNSGSEPPDNTKNINSTRGKEENPGEWKNSYVDPKGTRRKVTIKNFFKKKGPLSLILTLLVGGGGILSVFSPSLLIIDFKEKMTNAFNDQLAVMDVRTTAMIKKKFKGTTSGVCTAKITFRCKMNNMSKGQIQRLEAAGVKVNTSGRAISGFTKIDSFEFEGKKVNAQQFAGSLQADPAFRGAMLKGYSPKLAGFADALAAKLFAKVGINKQKNITGDTDEERQKSVMDHASGDSVTEADAKVTSSEVPCEDDADDCVDGKKKVYTDIATGKELTQEQYDARVKATSKLAAEFKARKALTETGKTATKATIKGALTSTALGLGAVDSACTGYTLIRAVSFAAKYLGALQLMRYAHTIMNTADSGKALEGTVEAMEYVGRILTTPNSEGKAATDSYGFKFAAYGDAPSMPRSDDIKAQNMDANGNNVELSEADKEKIAVNDETTKYINGQLVSGSVLAGILTFVGKASTSEADDFCGFVKSGWGQTILIGGALVGAVAAFFSGGLTLTWGAAVQVAASVAFSVALAMLTPKLIDMAAGTIIGPDEINNGNRTGNAVASGMGTYNDQTSSARGVPALKKKDALVYDQLTQQTLARYAEVDRATHSPLDATSPNTFMGSLVSRLLPYTTKLSSVSGGLASLTQFTTASFASAIPSVSAQDPTAKYNICEDKEYVELELAVDPFCNIRHGMKSETLAMDSDTVIDYMVSHDYVDEVTAESKDAENEYAKYIKNCMERSVSLGGYTEDNDNKGEECIQGSAKGDKEYKHNMFRLFFIDKSINDGMENGMANSGGAAAATTNNGTVKSPVTASPTITSGYGPRGAVGGASNASTWHAGIDIVAQPTDVVAAMAGEVVSIGGTADTVTIKHADGLKTLYLHMYPKDVLVKVGDKVTAGQKIGKIGCAGKEAGICGGDHLHFNIWIDEVKDKGKYSKYKSAPAISGGSAGKAINPANFLTDSGVAGYKGAVNAN